MKQEIIPVDNQESTLLNLNRAFKKPLHSSVVYSEIINAKAKYFYSIAKIHPGKWNFRIINNFNLLQTIKTVN